jgi:FkbM family methyltransferase
LFPHRTVKRKVHGVELYMPWSHLLPDYVRGDTRYDRNLTDLAASLARRSHEPFRMLDIGANIGDSTLRVLHRVEGRALCVEADPYWARFLRLNAGSDPRVTIEQVLLLPEDDEDADASFVADRGTTTTTWVRASESEGAPRRLSVRGLREHNPEFAKVRLIKSDTDGFDPVLVAAAARAWRESGPVVFFEYDPPLARRVGNDAPERVWEELAACGYSHAAIWDNTGDPLGQLELDAIGSHAAELAAAPGRFGYQFWDVAVCRADDEAALATFDELLPAGFDPRGERGAPAVAR